MGEEVEGEVKVEAKREGVGVSNVGRRAISNQIAPSLNPGDL